MALKPLSAPFRPAPRPLRHEEVPKVTPAGGNAPELGGNAPADPEPVTPPTYPQQDIGQVPEPRILTTEQVLRYLAINPSERRLFATTEQIEKFIWWYTPDDGKVRRVERAWAHGEVGNV